MDRALARDRQGKQSFRDLVTILADGRELELDPEATEAILDAAGRTVGDLAEAVELEIQRRRDVATVKLRAELADKFRELNAAFDARGKRLEADLVRIRREGTAEMDGIEADRARINSQLAECEAAKTRLVENHPRYAELCSDRGLSNVRAAGQSRSALEREERAILATVGGLKPLAEREADTLGNAIEGEAPFTFTNRLRSAERDLADIRGKLQSCRAVQAEYRRDVEDVETEALAGVAG
jgi:hypothetical protein